MDWEIALLQLFNQELTHPILDAAMVTATVWGLWLMPLAGIIIIALGHVRIGRAMIAALIAGILATFIFYYLAMRPRPVNVRLLLPTPAFPSFPSGHATMAFATATIAWLAYRSRIGVMNRLARLGLTSCVWGLAGTIGFSRLYLGHHYATDVLGGMVSGICIGAAAYGLLVSNEPWPGRLRWLLWPQVAVVILITAMAYMNLLPGNLLSWPFADKALHFLLFGAVAFWLNLWFNGQRMKWHGIQIPLAILVPLLLAMAEEGVQIASPLRTGSLLDLAADAAGMGCFYLLSEKLFVPKNR